MKRIKISAYLQSALLIALGILSIANPSRIVSVIPVIMGVILILVGLGKLFNFFFSSRRWKSESDLVLGSILFFLGLLFLIRQQQALNIIAVLWGLIGITTATTRLHAAALQRRLHQPCWFDVISGLIGLALGLVLMFSIDASLNFHIVFTGIYVLFSGLMLLIGTFLTSRSIKAIKEEQLREDNIIDIDPSDDQND